MLKVALSSGPNIYRNPRLVPRPKSKSAIIRFWTTETHCKCSLKFQNDNLLWCRKENWVRVVSNNGHQRPWPEMKLSHCFPHHKPEVLKETNGGPWDFIPKNEFLYSNHCVNLSKIAAKEWHVVAKHLAWCRHCFPSTPCMETLQFQFGA